VASWQRTLSALVLAVAPFARHRQAPAGWTWTLDSPARHVTETDHVPEGTFGFVAMAPGWHITMGPGGLLYDPRQVVSGRFVLESRHVLFPHAENTEYGLFIGGKSLNDSTRTWTAFVVRRDGSAAVLRHANGHTDTLRAWTQHPGVKPHPGGNETVVNVLRVVLDTAVAFSVNDSLVATASRGAVPTDGIVGFRIGRALNMHITTLDLTHRLAPAR
jgi:hypothetical protein